MGGGMPVNKVQLKAPVELSVAADAGMMLVVRLTTAGVVARAGLTVDVMDNLKMATEEACNCLIGQENPPERIALRFEGAENSLVISVCAGEDGACQGGFDEAELDVVRCILEALADDVAFDVCDGWIRGIELRAKLA